MYWKIFKNVQFREGERKNLHHSINAKLSTLENYFPVAYKLEIFSAPHTESRANRSRKKHEK